MIKSFSHKGLEEFFTTGSKKGIQPKHAKDNTYDREKKTTFTSRQSFKRFIP